MNTAWTLAFGTLLGAQLYCIAGHCQVPQFSISVPVSSAEIYPPIKGRNVQPYHGKDPICAYVKSFPQSVYAHVGSFNNLQFYQISSKMILLFTILNC